MERAVYVGNAVADSPHHRGWLLGHFLETGDPRSTTALEVKWGVHPAQQARTSWAVNREATTLAILVRGRFVLTFPDRQVVLEREGDYVLWMAGTPHHWRAEAESVVLTVRWPSQPGDSYDLSFSGDTTIS